MSTEPRHNRVGTWTRARGGIGAHPYTRIGAHARARIRIHNQTHTHSAPTRTRTHP